MNDFWQNLKKPFLVLAPMEDVTDTVFRRIISDCGKPDVFFTEFTSVEGLLSNGSSSVKKRLLYTEKERPIIAQIWGEKPINYFRAAKIIAEMKFDGVDINMGCPDKKVIKKGVCSALIKNRNLASEIIQATKEGIKEHKIPLSIKTRIGFNAIETESWISFLLNHDIDALTIHARTVKELSKIPAHWDEIKKAVEIRNQLAKKTVIIGNGDVSSYQDAIEKASIYKADGIMIGRGIFSNLWLFNNKINKEIRFEDKIKMLLKHMRLFEKTWQNQKSFHIMKKFFKCYINGIDNAQSIREELVKVNSREEAEKILLKLINKVS